MKTLYKSIFGIALGVISLTVSAQKDTTLIREVSLEREYSPILQDASKINTQPAVYSPLVKAKDIKFVNTSPQISLDNKLGIVPVGNIQTQVGYDRKRGYATLAGGRNNNIDIAAGYRIVDEEDDKLDIFATHNSFNGIIDYLQQGYLFENAKAKYADTKVKLKYRHSFDPSILSFDASFFNTNFNYYGNTFVPQTSLVSYPFNRDNNQNVNVINIGAGLKSSEYNLGTLKYDANLRYRNFATKYGALLSQKGMKGGQIDLDADFYIPFGDNNFVGIKGGVMSQHLGNEKQNEFDDIAYHGFSNLKATPYVTFKGDTWGITLGVNTNIVADVKASLLISPDVKASVQVNDYSLFYGEVTGGVNNNTVLDILQENRYANPSARVEYSKTAYDVKAGFKSGAIRGFEFDLFAGYKLTQKDHLYLYSPSAPINTQNDYLWGNVASPVYADVTTGHVGGLLKTSLIPYTTLSAKLAGYFTTVKYVDSYLPAYFSAIPEAKAWGRPTFVADLSADVQPIQKLTLSMNYHFEAGRKTYFVNTIANASGQIESMKSINELNFKGEYQLLDWLSLNLKLNNILFQKYEVVYGYPMQGFNIQGGVNLKF